MRFGASPGNNRPFLAVLFLLSLPCLSRAVDYRQDFYTQMARHDRSAMDRTLKDWKNKRPDDVEWLIANGHYFHEKARLSPKKNKPIDRSAQGIVRSPSSDFPKEEFKWDPKYLRQAAQSWNEALERSPERLDLSFCLADLYLEGNNYEALYGTLQKTLQYAEKNQAKLRWTNGTDLTEPPSAFIPSKTQAYISYYFGPLEAKSAVKALRLARLIMTYYPEDADSYNSVGLYYSIKKNWPKSLKYLIIASRKEPGNSLYLCNIGRTLRLLNKKREARIYFQKVLELNNDPENMAEARKQMGELKD